VPGGLLRVGAPGPQSAGVASLQLTVDGDPAGLLRGHWLPDGSELRLAPGSSHSVTLVATSADGRRFSATYRYGGCPTGGGGGQPPTMLPARAGG
jgi:hypothetical protein